MLHEIEPKLLDTAFSLKSITANSIVFSFKDGAVLVSSDPDTCFPLYGELDFEPHEATYLFEVDGIDCFLVRPESIAALSGYSYENVMSLVGVKPKHLTFAGITALHLNAWYHNNRFCGACGSTLEPSTVERMLFCPQCKNAVYPRISPVVIVGVYHSDKLLLTRYANRPYKNYALIAGFIEIGETVEEAVKREVAEEVGLQVKNLQYYKSQPWGLSESLIMGFFAELDGDQTIEVDTSELSEAVWVRRNDIEATLDDMSLTNEMMVYFKENQLG